jgi:hypothetical protein
MKLSKLKFMLPKNGDVTFSHGSMGETAIRTAPADATSAGSRILGPLNYFGVIARRLPGVIRISTGDSGPLPQDLPKVLSHDLPAILGKNLAGKGAVPLTVRTPRGGLWSLGRNRMLGLLAGCP